MDDVLCVVVVRVDGLILIEEFLCEFIKWELNIIEDVKFMENVYVFGYIVFFNDLLRIFMGKFDWKVVKNMCFFKM